MDFWASLEHKIRYKKNLSKERLDEIDKEHDIVYSAFINIKTNKNKTKLENEEFKFIIYQYIFYENTMSI